MLLTTIWLVWLLLSILALGGVAYYLLALQTAWRKRQALQRETVPALSVWPAISVLKPLRGADAGLSTYLETFFRQDYPAFELLFAVRHAADPAVAVVEALRQRYPHIPVQLLLTGEPPYANAKVYSMQLMAAAAAHDILVITDSDASVAPDYLRDVARCFAPPEVGALTHLYRGVAAEDFWSKLEALGMSAEFMAGVLMAERMEGMKFALGPSMAIRRECLDAIGGFAAMADYLADDFVLGNWADRAGYRVVLSCRAINHHATATGWWASFKHRLRWNRSTRYSRPDGYIGQGFTYGLSWAFVLTVLFPGMSSLALLAVNALVRALLAWQLGVLLNDPAVVRRLWLLPLQDVLSWASWLGGFAGREISWRNERYRLLDDGRFEPVVPRAGV